MCWKGCLYPICSIAWISSCLIKSLLLPVPSTSWGVAEHPLGRCHTW